MISSISYSHVAQFIGANRALVSFASATVINQIAIYLLKSRTLENINKIPAPILDPTSAETLTKGIEESRKSNQSVISLIRTQNKYKALSTIISIAAAVFCFHRNIQYIKYAAPVLAILDIVKFVKSICVIKDLQKYCPQISVRPLKQKNLEEISKLGPAFSITLQGKEIQLKKQTIGENKPEVPISDLEKDDPFAYVENSTNATHFDVKEPKPEPQVEISYRIGETTLVGTYYLR